RRRGLAGTAGEPLAQQHGQVITHQPAQFSRGAEITVGGRGVLLDTGQQVSQTRVAVGCRRLDIQQPRQPTRQLELLLQPETRAPGRSCPYRCQYSPMNTSLCARYAGTPRPENTAGPLPRTSPGSAAVPK